MMLRQKTTLLQNDGEKERQEDYPTLEYMQQMYSSVVFTAFFFAVARSLVG